MGLRSSSTKGGWPMPTPSSPPVEILPCSGEMLQKGARIDDDIPKIGKSTGRRAGNRGLGRKKGSENRIPKSVKDMILAALENAGGQQYLEEQARQNPVAFLSLVGKLIRG